MNVRNISHRLTGLPVGRALRLHPPHKPASQRARAMNTVMVSSISRAHNAAHLHSKGPHAAADLASDTAETYDGESLALQLLAHK